jgi:hypothetical protein
MGLRIKIGSNFLQKMSTSLHSCAEPVIYMYGFLSFEEALTHQLLMMNYNEMGEGQTFSTLET